ncbi:methyl-accepting chemotaxis protein [Chitinivorax tropicus]|uniref:Methyl-accepting chemotaxis protein n=1 Tax=Chitinivorax tropicus TaxID=714531 RepID=A0A840ML31_9PROT|nr:methyl-accepting chemotaxis protein [Chitinivorax tropicus]MBB5019358.1 methyl-accepting chemotaxis protein [Chitinivorax tropicus]
MKQGSTKNKLYLFAMLMAGLVALMGWSQHRHVSALSEAQSGLKRSFIAVRSQVLMDMIHDGLRADVLQAVVYAREGDKEKFKEVKVDLAEHRQVLKENIAAIERLELPDDIRKTLEATKTSFVEYERSAETIVERIFNDAKGSQALLDDFNQQFEKMEQQQGAFTDQLTAWADQIDQQATAVEGQAKQQSILFASVAVVLAFVLGGLLARSISQAVNKVVGAIQQVRDTRDYRTRLRGLTGEFNQLANSFNAILDDMQNQQDEIATQLADNLRVKVALDSVSSGVMIADAQRQIVYANPAVMALLKHAEQELQQVIPGFHVSSVMGGSIDRFHQNPNHQIQVLGNLATTHRARIQVGKLTLQLVVNPVLDAQRNRLGTVVEWADLTEQIKAEAELESIIEAAAEGDYSRRASPSGKSGFLRAAAEGINRIMETTSTAIKDVGAVLEAMAEGDLTRTVTRQYNGDLAVMQNSIHQSLEQMQKVISQIRETADAINMAASEIATGNADLARRTELQASGLEQTTGSMAQLTETVKQNASSAQHASTLVKGSAEIAAKGGKVVGGVVHTMNAIADSSRKIADIIGVIDGIAFQTNILALNAAVEAARAGEQGRGFAVVAGEVRNLAQRSAAAAKEIKDLIQSSVTRVNEGAKLVADAGATMNEIVESVQQVNDIVTRISTASKEQSDGIEQVGTAIRQMDAGVQQNAALVEQASANAKGLEEQAHQLVEVVSGFKSSQGGSPVRGRPPATRLLPRKQDQDDTWEAF